MLRTREGKRGGRRGRRMRLEGRRTREELPLSIQLRVDLNTTCNLPVLKGGGVGASRLLEGLLGGEAGFVGVFLRFGGVKSGFS